MSSRPNILVVEDDTDILQLLSYNVQASGFKVLTCMDGLEALQLARQHFPSLIILDLMLPGMDGFEVCKHLKQGSETKDIPVLVLTARGEEVDRIVGLELGAEDYVVKPFSPRELMLRVKAILRRSAPRQRKEAFWENEWLRIDIDGHKVLADGSDVGLTVTEFKLLTELVTSPGKVHTRDQLLYTVWGYEFDGYARTVDTHVRRLRQKLGKHSECIETVRGVGYRFKDR